MTATRGEVHTPVCCAHPFVGFVCTPNAVIDFSNQVPSEFGHGATIEIDHNGFRNSDLPRAKPSDEFWIGLFGGSVAFGAPASNNQSTIAACLERCLNTHSRRDGRRVRVLNLAILAGHQPQQLILLLLNRQVLDAAVTFDGVNEVVVPSCYNDGSLPSHFPYRPYYEILFAHSMSEEQICETVLLDRMNSAYHRRPRWQQRLLAARHARAVARRRATLTEMTGLVQTEFRSMFGGPPDGSPSALATRGAESWREHTALMHSFCQSQRIDALFAVQPIPDRAKPLTAAERAHLDAHAEIVAIRSEGYDKVLRHAEDLRAQGCPVVSLADVFAGCHETIYTDLIHFEDRGSSLVAKRLAELIVRSWPGFGA
jgi:hypothetical protein